MRKILGYSAFAVLMVSMAAVVVRFCTTPPTTPYDPILANLGKQRTFSIVEVGAYIGDTPNDPLFPFLNKQMKERAGTDAMKVVLIEPIKEYFDQLRANYGNSPSIQFENIAIAATDGTLEMYRLAVDPVKHGYPEWLSQMSSLSKERMEEVWDRYEKFPEYKKFYLENRTVEVVRSMPLRQLLKKHDIKELDLLQIDAEGYDFEILKTLDFAAVKPRFINYERVLLKPADEAECRQMLEKQGYVLVDWEVQFGEHLNTLCIRKDCLNDYAAESVGWYDPAGWRFRKELAIASTGGILAACAMVGFSTVRSRRQRLPAASG